MSPREAALPVGPPDGPADAARLDAVTRRYRVGPPAVDGVSLALPRGSYTALVGPSGCGKTTLLHLLGGLDRPTSGRVVVDGCDVTTASDRRRTALRREAVGFVFQRFNLHPKLSALENVTLPLSFGPPPTDGARSRAARLLDEVGLAGLAHRRPAELSGGEQQRVAVARALVAAPALILADEPTGNLDRATGRSLLDLLDRVAAAGQTLFVATHDPAVAARADAVLHMADGRLRAEDIAAGDRPVAVAR